MVAGSWIDHEKLQIVKGVGKTPTDTFSAENDPVVVNLLSGVITLDPSGWSPQIAATKGGGVWADSPITDGRTLLAAPEGNVTEKMTLVIADRAYLSVVRALSGLNRMVKDCRDFWQTGYQIDPVYLVWKAKCGAGEQYALLYNIEISPEYKDGPDPIIIASVTLEREPFWRGIPPGANPKLWAFFVNGKTLGTNGLNYSNVALEQNNTISDSLFYDTAILNKFEWDKTDYINNLSRNYIDIPASSIPGDAPALVQITYAPNSALTPSEIYIAKSTKPKTVVDNSGLTQAQSNTLNVGDATLISGMAKTIDAVNGVISNNTAATKYIGSGSIPGASSTSAVTWDGRVGGTGSIFFDEQVNRGTYAVFFRCAQTSGAAGDLQARLSIQAFPGTVVFTGTYQSLPVQSSFEALYLGVISLPITDRNHVSANGRGLYAGGQKTGLHPAITIFVQINNTNAAARTMTALDLVFVPIDESAVDIKVQASSGSGLQSIIYDNTGYFNHGDIGNVAIESYGAAGSPITDDTPCELSGTDITLTPHVNNRLYFLALSGATQSSQAIIPASLKVAVNIVPRWSSIRDV